METAISVFGMEDIWNLGRIPLTGKAHTLKTNYLWFKAVSSGTWKVFASFMDYQFASKYPRFESLHFILAKPPIRRAWLSFLV